MTGAVRRRLRRLRRGAWYVLAGVLVTMALVAGAVSQLLPLAERHPERIAEWLSARAQRTVRFDRVQTAWTRRGALLRLDGLRIGDGAQTIHVGNAEILVSQYAGLLPGRSFTELRVRGLDLTLEHDAAGQWHVRGLPASQQSASDPFDALEGLGELQVIGGRLRIAAPDLGIAAQIPSIDVRLRVDGARLRIGARARMRVDGAPLDASVDFDRRAGDGRAYFAMRRTDLSAWSSLLRGAGVVVDRGSGDLQAWAELRQRRLTAVTFVSDLAGLGLQGAPLAAASAAPRVRLQRVYLRGRWQAVGGGWRVDMPRFRVAAGGGEQALDGLVVAGGQRVALLADRIDAGTLLELATLSDRVPAGARQWLIERDPDAVLREVRIAGRGGALQAHLRIENGRFAAHGEAPGIAGLGGVLDGDGDGFAFAFDPAATFRFDWPRGFGAAHEVHLRGTFAGWRDGGGGWSVQTTALRIAGIGYGADVRGGLRFAGDGSRPSIDIAARVDDTDVTMAKRFWVHNRMSPRAVDWLDRALSGGRVVDGRAVVSGDLDDWPFRAEPGQPAKGLFQADARLVGAVVKFQPEWPAADHIDGDVSFVADGFSLTSRAALGGVPLARLDGGIARYGEARLLVDADTAPTDAGALLALMKKSPLYRDRAQTLDNLDASGPARATLALDLLMRQGAPPPKIDGTIALDGAKLGEKRSALDFDDVRGTARYDGAGFEADGLRALQRGAPRTLSLRAGAGHVRDPAQAFEATLDATLGTDELLDRAPDLAWLKPYLSGRSAWNVALTIPKASSEAGAAPTRLQLRSGLVGTQLDLPAPMHKPAAVPLPTVIDARLPFGAGDVTVAFGKRLALRARSGNDQTGVRVVLGSDTVAEAAPASGLVATGHAGDLDAIDWVALTAGGSGGKSLPLRRIDLSADNVLLLGGRFPSTRVRASPSGGGTLVQVDGTALAGTVQIPQAAGATIVARFQRMHWVSAATPLSAATDVPADGTPVEKVDDGVDPSKIPPLDVRIDDTRFGDAVFGNAVLRTQPIASGLRIAQLQTRAPGHQIDVSGDWLGRGAAARTHLVADVHSGDFGDLLSGFGFGGRVAGGSGDAKLDAAWAGSPAAFKPGNLQGTLALTVKDGRLVELKPGAGRVLGLLSVAELPRRLMLDFSDFFAKGFAFNRIGGNVRFGGGQARSDDLAIEGPAADIRIRGGADLRAQTFDQRIDVYPKSGNLLTVAGAIAGGPIGAAVGAVANAVLKKPLGEVGAKTYHVTGPWKDPKVEVGKHEEAEAAATSRSSK